MRRIWSIATLTLSMRNKHFLITVLILFMTLVLSSCQQEQTEDILIVYTNDVAGEVNGNIGYAGVKAFKDQLKAEHRYVSLVDAGDFFDGDYGHQNDGKDILSVMNAAGYDVVAIGNQEFSIGLDALADNVSKASFPFVSCNLNYLGKGKNPLKGVKPYTILRYGPTKIAFIGVTTPETLTPGKPAYEAITKDGELLYGFYEGSDGEELYEQVQKTVDKAAKKADYVIVLSHLGSNSVKEGFSSYDLIDHCTGIDVVIDAHSHTVIFGEGVYDSEGNDVVLTSTGEKLEYVGLLSIHPDRTYTTVLYPNIEEKDPTVQGLIDSLFH